MVTNRSDVTYFIGRSSVTVLLPFRLLYAVFQFLNFFIVRYTGDTLTGTGNARQKHAER